MTTVALLLAVAAAGFALVTWLRIPSVPVLIAFGVGIGATGLLGEQESILNTLSLGLAVLMFFLGTELDLSRVRKQRGIATIIGVARIVVIGGAAFGIAMAMGLSAGAAFYTGLAMAASSTLLAITLLRQREQFFEPFGRLVVGVLLVQNLLIVLLLPAIAASDAREGALGVLGTLSLILLAWVCTKWACPWLLVRLQSDAEILLLLILAVLFAFVGLAYWMGLPIITGALLAGLSMSGFPVRDVVRGQVSSLADFFVAVFFVTLGAVIDLRVLWDAAILAVPIASVLLIAPPLVIIIARKSGFTTHASVESSHLLTQCGELSLVISLLGLQQGYVDSTLFAAIALIAIVTMVLTPVAASHTLIWNMLRLRPRLDKVPADSSLTGHVLFLGCGEHARTLMQQAEQSGLCVIGVDDDPAVVKAMFASGMRVYHGNGVDPRVLHRLRARHALVIYSSMRRFSDNERLLQLVRGPQIVVRAFELETATRLTALGATTIVESQAAADDLLRWIKYQKPNVATHHLATKPS